MIERVTTKDYTDAEIVEICVGRKGKTVESEFYRHKAYLMCRAIEGLPVNETSENVFEWSERMREIGNIKYSVFKQAYYLIQVWEDNDWRD